MAYKKENRFRITARLNNGTTKTVYPKSIEQKELNLEICKENGFKVLECVKLYPFSTERNQHNFMLISNICSNEMSDMRSGEQPWDEELYETLYNRKERADYFFSLPLPVAWLPFKEWEEAKEMATAAILHRQDCCIEHGRADLVQYC